jgi:hypothetical protein
MRTRNAAIAAAFVLALVAPAAARAAEVVVDAPPEVHVTQGEINGFYADVRAEGVIGCLVTSSSPATVRFDTVYSIVGGKPAPAALGDPQRFYANGSLVLLPPLGCGTTWDGAPTPYKVGFVVAAASNTAPGAYRVPLSTDVTNPGGALFAPLKDEQPTEVTVVVDPPGVPGAHVLPRPFENQSINLLPVRGDVRVRYPGTNVSVPLTEPVQVPPATGVNALNGFVDLLSDRVGTGVPQQTTLWQGVFGVDYTRLINQGSGKTKQAKHPITLLTVRGGPNACGSGARASRKRRGGRLWASGKGRFRTKGRYGAGTVRGTKWFTENTCEGTLYRVVRGVVTVLDTTLDRTFAVGPGTSYLVQPPGHGGSRG